MSFAYVCLFNDNLVIQSTVPILLIEHVRDMTFPYDDRYVKEFIVVIGTLLCTIPPVVLFYFTADSSVPLYINPLIKKAFKSMEGSSFLPLMIVARQFNLNSSGINI
jgi:hypothetical protein